MEIPEFIVFPALGIFETWGSKLSHGISWMATIIYRIILPASVIT